MSPETLNRQNIYGSFRIRNYDDAAFRDAVRDLFRRHIVLSSQLHFDTTPPQVNYVQPKDLPIRTIDLNADAVDITAEADELLLRDTRLPFRLDESNIRITLVPTPDGGCIGAVTIHHLIGDGQTTEILIHDLAELYDAHTSKRTAELPSLEAGYDEFAAHQREMASNFAASPLGTQWQRCLDALAEEFGEQPSPYVLPDDSAVRSARTPWDPNRFRSGLEEDAVGEARVTVGPADRERAEARRGRSRVPESIAGLTALQHALSEWTGSPESFVLFATEDRYPPKFAGAAGIFLDLIPIRRRIEPAMTMAEVAASNRLQLRRHIGAGMPFPIILEMNPAILATFLASDVVVMQYFPPPLLSDRSQEEAELARRDFTMNVVNPASTLTAQRWLFASRTEGLSVTVHYDSARWQPETMDRLVSRVAQLFVEGFDASIPPP